MSIFARIFALTETMLSLSKQQQWQALAQAENQRKQLFYQLHTKSLKDAETVAQLKKLIAINEQILSQVSAANVSRRQDLLTLQRGKKIRGQYNL